MSRKILSKGMQGGHASKITYAWLILLHGMTMSEITESSKHELDPKLSFTDNFLPEKFIQEIDENFNCDNDIGSHTEEFRTGCGMKLVERRNQNHSISRI